MLPKMTLDDYANYNAPSSRLSAIDGYLIPETVIAPIDMYRATISAIINYGTSERLDETSFLGRLSLVGLVSAAEGYIRWVLSSCIEICPIAQATAASKMINLGGLLWHGRSGFSRSAFEHALFASKSDIAKVFVDFLGFKLEDSKFKTLLDEFDKVCQLRHGIAHGDGFMPGRNAVQLDLRRYDAPLRIKIGYSQLQEAAAVVNTLIFTLNRELFVEMCRRWAISWRRRSDWESSKELEMFNCLFTIFHSGYGITTTTEEIAKLRDNCLQEAKTIFAI